MNERYTLDDLCNDLRQSRSRELNETPNNRESLEKHYGAVYNTVQLAEEFEVLGFAAPFVVVKRKIDGVIGSLEFQHHPRYYFNFKEDNV